MRPDLIELVDTFRARFGLPEVKTPTLDLERLNFRFNHLAEELEELRRAGQDEDLPGAADALIDLIYVALGACRDLGIPTRELFLAVHHANMQKTKVVKPHDSKRGDPVDIVKPPGWQCADVDKVLIDAGWEPKK